MRPRDLIGLAVASLLQSKARAATTLVGIALGAAMLALSLSLGHGLRTAVAAEFHKEDRLRKIFVTRGALPAADESAIPQEELVIPAGVGDARRERVRQYLIRRWRARQPRVEVGLTPDRLAAIARLDHVVGVVPEFFAAAEVAVNGEPRATALALLPPGHAKLTERVVFGRLPDPERAELALPEALLFDWGVVDDAAIERLLGQTLRVEVTDDKHSGAYLLKNALGIADDLAPAEMRVLDEAAEKLPELLDTLDLTPVQKRLVEELRRRGRGGPPERATAKFVVVGVFRDAETRRGLWFDDLGDREVVVSMTAGRALLERLPRVTDHGYYRAVVTVDGERHLRDVSRELARLGLRADSMLDLAERGVQEVTLIGLGMTALSLLALVVAGLGIANTMATSVLERTRDIGIMKAVGARDRDILGAFLLEGSALGLGGGLLGLALARLAAWAADGWIRRAMEQITDEQVAGTVFPFPGWLVAAVPAFTLALTAWRRWPRPGERRASTP